MKIIRAKHFGMCFGVRDAIALALDQGRRAPLTIFGDLVHNDAVLAALRQRGVQVEQDPGKVLTQDVMITAHGASEQTRQRLRNHGLRVMEATCPLVHHAHAALQRLVQEGYHPVVVGKPGHVEVRGLTEDLPEYNILLAEEEVTSLPEKDKFGVVAQTTQPIERVQHIVETIRRRFPHAEVRFEDTVCQPTKQRQTAAVDLARQSDVVVVVGGAHSNNTRELVNTCARYCRQVHHVETAAELQPEWFSLGHTVGVTAGTSTPDVLIEGVEEWLRAFAQARESQNLKPDGSVTQGSSPRERTELEAVAV